MRAEAAVGVERERAAVERELVLTADHVEIDERQPAFDDARDRDGLANGELVALVRRGVGHEQNFAPRFEDAFDRVGTPDVLADRNADAHAAKDDRSRRRSGGEDALLVEDAVIGQIDLEPHRLDPPAIEERRGVIELAVLDPGQADQGRRPAVGGVAREFLAGRPAGLLESGLQHQILGRIAREIEFGRKQDVGAKGGGFFPRFAQAVAIARDVADDRGDLGERDDEAVADESGHESRLSPAGEAGANASLPDAGDLRHAEVGNARSRLPTVALHDDRSLLVSLLRCSSFRRDKLKAARQNHGLCARGSPQKA